MSQDRSYNTEPEYVPEHTLVPDPLPTEVDLNAPIEPHPNFEPIPVPEDTEDTEEE